MADIKFPIDGVKRILAHSLANPVFTPSLSQMFEGRYRKDGVDFSTEGGGWPTADDVDGRTLSPQTYLVKDAGTYLMAATEVVLPGDATENFVVYAEGMDPNKDSDYYDTSRRIFGGDDFSEVIPLDWLQTAVTHAEKHRQRHMVIRVSASNFTLVLR